MPIYRLRRPTIEVQAEQWFPGSPPRDKRLGVRELDVRGLPTLGVFRSFAGELRVVPGDYIIIDDTGDRVLMAKAKFEAMYEPVESGSDT